MQREYKAVLTGLLIDMPLLRDNLGDYTSEGMTARRWTFCMNASGKWKVKIDETGWLYRILSGRYEIGFPRLCLRQALIPLYDSLGLRNATVKREFALYDCCEV